MIHVTNGAVLQESSPASRTFNFQAVPSPITRNLPFPVVSEGGATVAKSVVNSTAMPWTAGPLTQNDCTLTQLWYRWVNDPNTVRTIESAYNPSSGWYSLHRDGRTFGVPHYSRTPFLLGFRIESFAAHFENDGTLYFGGTGIRMGYYGTTDTDDFFVPEFNDGGATVTLYEIILETQNRQQVDYLYTVTGGET